MKLPLTALKELISNLFITSPDIFVIEELKLLIFCCTDEQQSSNFEESSVILALLADICGIAEA